MSRGRLRSALCAAYTLGSVRHWEGCQEVSLLQPCRAGLISQPEWLPDHAPRKQQTDEGACPSIVSLLRRRLVKTVLLVATQ